VLHPSSRVHRGFRWQVGKYRKFDSVWNCSFGWIGIGGGGIEENGSGWKGRDYGIVRHVRFGARRAIGR